MSKEKPLNLIVYKSHWQTFLALPDDKLKELIKQIIKFVEGEEPTFDDDLLNVVWITLKHDYEKQRNNYALKVENNRKNGKLGGRPKTQHNPENPNGYLETHNNPNNPTEPTLSEPNPKNLKEKDKEKDNDKEKEKDIEKDKEKDTRYLDPRNLDLITMESKFGSIPSSSTRVKENTDKFNNLFKEFV